MFMIKFFFRISEFFMVKRVQIMISGTTKQQIVKTYQWKCQAWGRHYFSEVQ